VTAVLNKGYIKYAGEQEGLDALARRFQSGGARYKSKQEKEQEENMDTKQAKDAEVDRRQKGLAEPEGQQVTNFRARSAEMAKAQPNKGKDRAKGGGKSKRKDFGKQTGGRETAGGKKGSGLGGRKRGEKKGGRKGGGRR